MSTTIHQVMQNAAVAFEAYRKVPSSQRATCLETIAQNMEALGDALIEQAAKETHLPPPRLVGERGRTTMQLRMFARMLREGSWVEASIDTADSNKQPPKPDIRKMLVPIGPVVVFGASNFPFAYSTAGGDTASALAAGCTVVVKAHPAHVATSTMVANAIHAACATLGFPDSIFQHVTDGSFEAGKALVQADATAAVGFTGSFSGGKALLDYAAARKNPIPVFAEMGSINPVIILPDALANNASSIAQQYAASITLGMGQFCTNPGLLITIEGAGLNTFTDALSEAIAAVTPAPMLHAGIHQAYQQKLQAALGTDGVTMLQQATAIPQGIEPVPTIATVSGADFLSHPLLHEEVFGPYSLLVTCKNISELKAVWMSVKGQLTTSIMATATDFANYPELPEMAAAIAGRLVFNGVPTGVEVCNSMVHGGPFPATTDPRFTAVGIQSVKRWVRPICYQHCPPEILPDALKDDNPLGIWRMVNNEWTR